MVQNTVNAQEKKLLVSEKFWIAVLFAGVVSSALGVVYAKHESRKFFVELQSLQKKQDQMDTEWGRLQLEQSTWATHGRIERAARNKLKMQIPAPESVIIIRP